MTKIDNESKRDSKDGERRRDEKNDVEADTRKMITSKKEALEFEERITVIFGTITVRKEGECDKNKSS